MLTIKGLSKNFGSIEALSDISFKAEQGDIISILGPNGAGKTTLIRILSGILSPSKGEILFDGVEISRNRVDVLRQIGYIAENSPMYGDMNGYEFIKYSAALHQIPKPQFNTRLEVLSTGLELKDILHRRISELSKGYRHRLGIASALIHNPKVLIMDEPSEGLDPNQKHIFQKFIKDFAAKGIVLMSTHILEDVSALSSRILLINQGKLIQDTTSTRFRYQMPEHDLAAVFRNLTLRSPSKEK